MIKILGNTHIYEKYSSTDKTPETHKTLAVAQGKKRQPKYSWVFFSKTLYF